ncbi:PREDICTED: uncharacterized protein LOC104597782 [Nelumbo nucifera]|uniref:Uncharacterized protein LOC104597782 n=1 Tax=Nelumbo nucifera TaxID=4432 RepID=A0A1U8A7C5_NELNU|nr:PREDICTED: uncharacterized protein LOC104597782 [Nelumbo nucifera]
MRFGNLGFASPSSLQRTSLVWIKPPHLHIKINTDGAWSPSKAAVSVIARDEFRSLLVAKVLLVKSFSPIESEFKAILEGLQLAKSFILDPIIIESDAKVALQVFNSVTRDLHGSIAYIETAQEIWKDLEDRYSQGNVSRIHQLKRDIELLNQGLMNVAAYFAKLKGLWDEMYALILEPVCICGATKDYVAEREREKLYQFLMGLNDNFNSIRSNILAIEPVPGINRAYALIIQEERHQSAASHRIVQI